MATNNTNTTTTNNNNNNKMVIRHKHSLINLLSSGLMGTSRAAYAEKYGRLVNQPALIT